MLGTRETDMPDKATVGHSTTTSATYRSITAPLAMQHLMDDLSQARACYRSFLGQAGRLRHPRACGWRYIVVGARWIGFSFSESALNSEVADSGVADPGESNTMAPPRRRHALW